MYNTFGGLSIPFVDFYHLHKDKAFAYGKAHKRLCQLRQEAAQG